MTHCQPDYLGDGVYARHDGYSVVLTTERAIGRTDTIYLEPEVLAALLAWLKRIGAVQEGTVQP